MIDIQCDLCGSETRPVSVIIEGTMLNACQACSKFGEIVKTPRIARAPIARPQAPEVEYDIVHSCHKLIKAAREKMGLKQEEAAIALNERVSLLQKIESGHGKPSILLAKKLEKFFRITLVEEVKPEQIEKSFGKQEGLTIADFVKQSRNS